MPYYRLFIHDAMGQVCEPARIIEAASDAEAMAKATQAVDGRAGEVWDERRRVGRIERSHKGPPDAP
jgi:hypothetical protein